MNWVTLKRVKMDRTASAWLIRRFLDREAEFSFVEKDEMEGAIAGGAKPFHNYVFTGTPREHSGFQELLMEHELDKSDPALVLMGQSVRAAERAGWAKDGSENHGLWAIANGISDLAGGNDAETIERMLPVYDALYAYCKQRALGEAGWKSDS
ncbi:MAG: chromate resistance protein ChrB domain-containing protein [Chloroflexia bacterium]